MRVAPALVGPDQPLDAVLLDTGQGARGVVDQQIEVGLGQPDRIRAHPTPPRCVRCSVADPTSGWVGWFPPVTDSAGGGRRCPSRIASRGRPRAQRPFTGPSAEANLRADSAT